jgi:hypothetical protein
VLALSAGVAFAAATPALADQIIPAGGAAFVYNGLYDLACTDLIVNGTLNTGTGNYVKVRNITIGSAGAVQGNGQISYSGTFSNSGTVAPGVQLAVSADCGTPTPQQIPTINEWMLMTLAGLLLLVAGAILTDHRVLRRRSETRGASR